MLRRLLLGFESEPIPGSKLANLQSYRYQGVDHSLVSKYVLNPYWSWLITLFPLWLAYVCKGGRLGTLTPRVGPT